MTDLDRKIAELKGWEHRPNREALFPGGKAVLPEGYSEPIKGSVEGWFHCVRDCNWSTDIAKAFELVDEVAGPKRDRLIEIDFMMGLTNRDPWVWRAIFSPSKSFRLKDSIAGEGVTRAEAICRAYIALKEWEGKK